MQYSLMLEAKDVNYLLQLLDTRPHGEVRRLYDVLVEQINTQNKAAELQQKEAQK